MKKSLVVALVSGALVMSVLAGCGKKEEAPMPAAPEAPAPMMENMTGAQAAPEAPAEAPMEAPAEAPK